MSDFQKITILFITSSSCGLLAVILGLANQELSGTVGSFFTGPFILLGCLTLPIFVVSSKIKGSSGSKILYGIQAFFLTYAFMMLFGFIYIKLFR